MELKRIAIDTSKSVFTLHGIDAADRAIQRRELHRGQVETFFSKLPPTEVVLEACGASHHWGRVLTRLGHAVRLIPPQYVKPYVKRGKNDRLDAEAICEAAGRPGMRFVPVKDAESQAEAMLLSCRELIVRQQTQASNALRGHASEFGVVAAKGITKVDGLRSHIMASDMPEAAKETLAMYGEHLDDLSARLEEIDERLREMHKSNEASQRLAAVPGIGPITALTLALGVDAARFEDGRHFAAWLGLTPREHSTGGKTRLGGISRAGNERLRQLLVVGAMAVIRHAKPGGKNSTAWLLDLLARKPRKVAAVALANKMARIAWAMMSRGQAYRRPVVAAG